MLNAVCLCAKCHFRFTDRPLEWVRWVNNKIGVNEHERLQEEADNYTKTKLPKIDWSDRVKFLKSLLKKLESSEIEYEQAQEMEREYWS